MARDINPIERSILTPTQTVSAGNAFERLGDASSGLSQLISNKANEIAISQSAIQGEKDATSGDAPKSLAPPLTKATQAYNNAVSDTEARHLVVSAREQIREAYANATNPANFTAETPAVFKAQLEGIVEGTLEHSRDTNRGKLQASLEQLAGDASIDMLKHSIDFDNKQTVKTMTDEVDRMTRERRDAVISGDVDQVKILDDALSLTLEDYGNQNAAIKRMIPDIKNKLDQNAEVDKALGDYAQAATDKQQSQYLSDLAHNKDNLSFDTWQRVTKEVMALDATEKKLGFEARAESNAQVNNAIQNGTIETVGDIMLFPNLSVTDQLQAMNKLEAHQQQVAKSNYSLVDAQKNIIQGTPALNTNKQKNDMFANARQQFEQATGRPMSLLDMWNSIEGTSPFAASGIPGVSMGADVPQFNDQISAQLTSNDPAQVAEAAQIFNNANNVKKTPNMIDIKGDALAIASHFNSLNLGSIDQNNLAQRVSDATLNAKDPEIQVRSQKFNKELAAKPKDMAKLFKQTFDENYVPGVSDQAMGVFRETFREQFLSSGSKDAALAATKYEMRAWGTSKYFEKGMVAQLVPEKELTIANIGHAFDNQLRINTQLYINRYKEAVEANNKLPENKRNQNLFKIEWISPSEQDINLQNLTDNDRVFSKLGESKERTELSSVAQAKPRVKINGHPTEIFLMPTPESRLGERVQFALYYYDKFGMTQPLPDDTSATGVAMFSPLGLEAWAPSVLEEQNNKQVKEEAIKFQRAQAKRDWEALKPTGVISKLLELSPLPTNPLRGTQEQRADIFRRMFSGDTDTIESLLKQRIQGPNAAMPAAKASDSDHQGITNPLNEASKEN